MFESLLQDFVREGHLPQFHGEAALLLHGAPPGDGEPEPTTIIARTSIRASMQRPFTQDFGCVFPLAKRASSTFTHIGVGRAANVDVTISLPEISSYHAYFLQLGADAFRVADAGSRNGTRLGLNVLAARTPVDITNGSRLYLGTHRFTFVTKQGLLGLLQSRANGAATSLRPLAR